MKRAPAPQEARGDADGWRGPQATSRRRVDASGPPSRSSAGDPGVPRTPCAFKALCTEGLTTVLLGGRGAVKDEIQEETKTKLIFSHKGDYFPQTQYRVLGVFAGSIECIVHALDKVLSRLVELGDEEKARAQPGVSELIGKEPGEYIFRLCLSSQMAGLLIGSAGENVKRLRHDTGAKVFIDNDTIMGHRLVRVIGLPDSIIRCLDQVAEIVHRDAGTDEFQQYARLLNFAAASSSSWEGEQASASAGATGRREAGRRGDGGGWAEGRAAEQRLGPAARGPPPPPLDRRLGEMLELLGEDLAAFPPAAPELDHCISCSIPASRVGALVGRAGEFVRHVEEESGAKVDIDKDDGGETRLMSCTGPLANTYRAHMLMMLRLRDIEEREARQARELAASARRTDDLGAGEGMARGAERDPEKLLAHIASLQRQLEEVKAGQGGRRRG